MTRYLPGGPGFSTVLSGEHRKKGNGGLVNGPMMRMAAASSTSEADTAWCCPPGSTKLGQVTWRRLVPRYPMSVNDVVDQTVRPMSIGVVG